MFAEPLNGSKDAVPPPRSIAGHYFDRLSDRCSCGKTYAEIAAAPLSAVNDDKQAGVWCHQGTLNMLEWNQIQAENARIMACCRS